MPDTKNFLDETGLSYYHSKIKTYIDTADGALATDIAGKQATIDSSHKLSSDLVDDTDKTHLFVSSTEKITWNAKQNAINTSNPLSADVVDDTSTTHKFVTSGQISTWNAKQDALTFDTTPTNNSSNPVTSGGVYTAINTVAEVANGRTATYVIDTNDTGTNVNAQFDSSAAEINISGSTSVIKLLESEGQTVAMSDLKVGDIILLTNPNIPDRWLGAIADTTYIFFKMETTKVDLDPYVTKSTFTAAGDLLIGTGNGTYSKLTKGSNGQILKSTSSGLQWANEYSYTLPQATSSALGGIKVGYPTDADSRLYAVQLSDGQLSGTSVGQAYVNVPWVAYESKSAANGGTAVSLVTTGEKYTWNNKIASVSGEKGVTASTNSGAVTVKAKLRNETASTNAAAYTAGGSSKFYAVQLDKDGYLGAYVPWENTAHTHSAGNGLLVTPVSINTLSSNVTYAVKPATNGGITVDASGVSLTTGAAPTAESGYTNAAVQLNNGIPYVAVPLVDPAAISTDYIDGLTWS